MGDIWIGEERAGVAELRCRRGRGRARTGERSSPLVRAVLTGCWVLVAGGLGLPLEAQDERAGVFGEALDVRIVNLEVVVTEKGERVTGLGPEDFIVTVDGDEVAVEFFTEVVEGRAVAREEEESGAVSLPALAPGEVVGTSYLLFIDEYFSESGHRDRWVDALIAQLPLLNPEDRMAIVAFDGRSLEMLSGWSQSVTTLTQVLEEAKERPTHGLQLRDETRTFDLARAIVEKDEALLGGDPAAGGPLQPLGLDEQQRIAEITEQVERAVLAASTALRSFAGPSGRRVFMLASGGWPESPAFWVAGNRTSTGLQDEYAWGDGLFGSLIETANRLGYTIYPVDVPGLYSVTETSGARTAGIGIPRGGLSPRQIDAIARRQQRRLIDRNLEEDAALDYIALETGGRALLNGANLKAFERVVEDTRTYYWIGFTPDWQGDDTEHEVVVEARRPRLDVRSRRSYSDLSRQTEVSMMVEASLRFGSVPSATPLVAAFGTPERAGRGKVMVPLQIQVPLDQVTFLPVRGGWFAEMELHVAVLDEQGDSVQIPVIPITLQGKAPPRPGQTQTFDTAITMRRRNHEVVVSLHDQLSGKIISTKIEVDPRGVDPRRSRDQRE